jgi:hypothetical protein
VSEVIEWVQPNEVLISCKRPERIYVPQARRERRQIRNSAPPRICRLH